MQNEYTLEASMAIERRIEDVIIRMARAETDAVFKEMGIVA